MPAVNPTPPARSSSALLPVPAVSTLPGLRQAVNTPRTLIPPPLFAAQNRESAPPVLLSAALSAATARLPRAQRQRPSSAGNPLPSIGQLAQAVKQAYLYRVPATPEKRSRMTSPDAQPAAAKSNQDGLSVRAQRWFAEHPAPKNAYGAVLITQIAHMFYQQEDELLALGITRKAMAKNYEVPLASLSTLIANSKHKALPVPALTPEQSAWLQQHPVERAPYGEITTAAVAKFFCQHQEQLNTLNISQSQLALFCGKDPGNTKKRVSEAKKRLTDNSDKLNEASRIWFEQYPWQKEQDGTVSLAEIDRFCYSQQRAMRAQKITQADLAKYLGLETATLVRQLWEYRKDNPARVLTTQAKALLADYATENITPDGAAKLWVEKKHEFRSRQVTRDDLAEYCALEPVKLKQQIAKLQQSLAQKNRPLSAEAQAWLERHGPKKEKNGKAAASVVAAFWFNQQKALEEYQIKLGDVARHCGLTVNFLKQAMQELFNQLHGLQLSKAQQLWFKQQGPATDKHGNADVKEVAAFYLQRKDQLKEMKVRAVDLASHYKIKYTTLCDNIKLIRSLDIPPLGAEDQHWLDQLQLTETKSVSAIARCCLQYQQQIHAHNIQRVHLARHFDIRLSTLNRAMRVWTNKSRPAAGEKPEMADDMLVIKQEAISDDDSEAEVEPWYQLLRQRGFANVPVLIPPDDELIALGHQQGPLRELLSTVDVNTLNFVNFPSLLHACEDAARQRLRMLVAFAQEGNLAQKIIEQGYYALYCDDENPQLGWGLVATRAMPPGFVVGIYSGVVYESHEEYQAALQEGDITLPAYAFEYSSSRGKRKEGEQKKKPLKLKVTIGGHLRTGDMAYVNTAKVATNNKIVAAAENNLQVVKAEHNILVYLTNRAVEVGEPLCLHYGERYRFYHHRPIKMEVAAPASLDACPQLGWLANNIDKPRAWHHVSFEIMPRLMAQSDAFRAVDACLVITDRENVIVQVIESATGQLISPQEALFSGRPLAVVQNNGGHHYHCWWAAGRNVSFTLMDDGMRYQVDSTEENHWQAIPATGFCMTDAAATALQARANNKLTIKAIKQFGRELRQQVVAFIRQAAPELRAELEGQIAQE